MGGEQQQQTDVIQMREVSLRHERLQVRGTSNTLYDLNEPRKNTVLLGTLSGGLVTLYSNFTLGWWADTAAIQPRQVVYSGRLQ